MTFGIHKLFRDKVIIRLTLISVCSFLIFAAVILWKWRELPPEIPFYYSLPRSEEQLGTPLQFLILPGLSVGFFIFNLLIGSKLYTKERLAALLLMLFSAITSVLLVITLVRIIFLIT